MVSRLVPMLYTTLKKGYSLQSLSRDVIAGVIVGIVALPLAIAFAIASGVKPEQGLFTAVVAGFIISAASGSRFQIGGPTGAFVVIVYNVVQQFGYEGLALATLMAGVMLVLMGAVKLGGFIKFIPYPLTIGFTGGIALIIFATQVRDFLGLDMAQVPAEFHEKIMAYAGALGTVNWYALALGGLTILILMFWPRVTHKVPGSLIAIVLVTAVVKIFELPVETIGSRFGAVPNMLPVPQLPQMSLALAKQVFPSAVTIALLAAIESLLSAVVADGMTGTRHRSNMEVMAQGFANIGVVFFGGIPATGAIARTATNIRNGAVSPIAGITHAVTLLLIMMFFAGYAVMIPMCVLAAILMKVAVNMCEPTMFVKIFRSGPRGDTLVLFLSFFLTVFVDLTVAIQTGVILAALLFMHRMSELTQSGYITSSMQEENADDELTALRKDDMPKGVEVFEIYGPFFFGVADKFKTAVLSIDKTPKVFILRMRHVPSMDLTALHALEDLYEKTVREGSTLVLSGIHTQPLAVLERSSLYQRIGEENITHHIDEALKRARFLTNTPEQSLS